MSWIANKASMVWQIVTSSSTAGKVGWAGGPYQNNTVDTPKISSPGAIMDSNQWTWKPRQIFKSTPSQPIVFPPKTLPPVWIRCSCWSLTVSGWLPGPKDFCEQCSDTGVVAIPWEELAR